jgi:repressor LexA
MRQPLTKKQYETYSFIVEYDDQYGYMPSMADLQKVFLLSSTDSVWERLRALEERGWIKRKKHHARWIEIL